MTAAHFELPGHKIPGPDQRYTAALVSSWESPLPVADVHTAAVDDHIAVVDNVAAVVAVDSIVVVVVAEGVDIAHNHTAGAGGR